MNHARAGIIILFGILCTSTFVEAATISGVVYDGLTLEQQKNSVITIDTTPAQTKLSKDGTYTFNVDEGEFTLTAEYRENGIVLQRSENQITVNQDGTYVIDIILLPELGNVPVEPLPSEEKELTIIDQLLSGPAWWFVFLGIVLAAAGYAIVNVRKNVWTAKPKHPHTSENETKKGETKETENSEKEMEKVELDKYAMEMIGHLKRGGNRLTQKELRGMMVIGEAKVSLVVSELENEKIIKKIKKGRSNILILTEKGIGLAEKTAEKNDSAASNE